MPTFNPFMVASTALLPVADDYPENPPVVIHTTAANLHRRSGASAKAKFNHGTQEYESIAVPAYQDTYKTGTASRTGLAFDVITGGSSWVDDATSPVSGKYILSFLNGADGQSFEVRAAASGQKLAPRLFIIRRGCVDSVTTKNPDNVYCFLELAYGCTKGSYAIEISHGKPITLWYLAPNASPNTLPPGDPFSTDAYASWVPVQHTREVFDAQSMMALNNGEFRITTSPDYTRGIFTAHLAGISRPLRHAVRPIVPDVNNPNGPGQLPDNESIRLIGKNGWVNFEVHPLRHSKVSFRLDRFPLGEPHPNLSNAKVVVNTEGSQPANMTVASSVSQGMNGDIRVVGNLNLPDAGDGLGSVDPVRFSSIAIIIPALWSRFVGGTSTTLRTMQVTEHMKLDDANRMMFASGNVIAQNVDRRYTGTGGQYAFSLAAGNQGFGGPGYQRVRGIAGHGDPGIQFFGSDTVNVCSIPWADNMEKLNVDLGYSIDLDGFAVTTALRILLEFGSISPKFLDFIPNAGAPPYPDGYIGQILGKGSGMNPAYRMLPDMTVFECIRDIVKNSGLILPSVFGFRSIPMYFWFDPWGNAQFQPYSPGNQFAVGHYSTVHNNADVRPIYDIEVSESTSQLRSEVITEGLDANTYEVLYKRRPLPFNKLRLGRRYPLVMRSGQYCSEAYVDYINYTSSVVASMGTTIATIRCPFYPDIWPGNLVLVSDDRRLGRVGAPMVVIECSSTYGLKDISQVSGELTNDSVLVCRNIENSLV